MRGEGLGPRPSATWAQLWRLPGTARASQSCVPRHPGSLPCTLILPMQLKRQGIAGIGPWKNTLVSYTPLNYINESVRHLLLGPADAGAAAAAATATNCRLCCQLSPVPPLLLRLAVRVAASTQAHMALIAAVRAVVAPSSPALRRLALHNPGLALRCPVCRPLLRASAPSIACTRLGSRCTSTPCAMSLSELPTARPCLASLTAMFVPPVVVCSHAVAMSRSCLRSVCTVNQPALS